MSEMDKGLKYWRTILPNEITQGDASSESETRARIDTFTQKLINAGHSPDQAGSIARQCARDEDRRNGR